MTFSLFDDLGRPLWQKEGACRSSDTAVFFPDRGASTKEAKDICNGCPVKEECLDYALMNGEKFGIWGGYSERERRRIKRKLNVTRPEWRSEFKEKYGLL